MTDSVRHRQHPPEGIPADIDTSSYNSIWEMALESIENYANHPAYHHLGTKITYRQLEQLSRQFAAYLQNRFNVCKGDRIALMLPNTLAHPVAMFGILRAGATVVNINPLFTPRELQAQLQDAECRIIVALDICTHALNEIIEQTRIEHVICSRLGDIHSPVRSWLINTITRYIKGMKASPRLVSTPLKSCIHDEDTDLVPVDLEQHDLAYLQYTGGTSGTPKAAMLSHGNIVANTLQAFACISPAFNFRNPYVITALPLYHIFALTANCFVVFRLGGCSHLVTNPRDMDRFINELKNVKPHAITGVNTLFNAMLKHPGFASLDFSKLQLTLAGGMSLQQSTADMWHKITGQPVIEAYGLTEASPAITTNPVDSKAYSGKIGLPLPSTEISIRDDNGNPLGINEPGELWVRGPQVMQGYWNQPEETARAITTDGWLKTGDIVIIDERGYLEIVDRKKDMIIISGFNVYPSEIEAVLCNHPAIDEAGVTGIMQNDGKETIKAVIVCNQQQLTAKQVTDYCRENLAAYKVPKIIEFRSTLPKTNVGKILRRAL